MVHEQQVEWKQEQAAPRRGSSPARKRRGLIVFIVSLLFWSVLVAGGLYGAHQYMTKLQAALKADVERQTAAQIDALHASYSEQISGLEAQYRADLEQIDHKVVALNELLAFARDNADSDTDNSNQLFTQLSKLEKQLNELKKNLDVLK